MNITIPIPDDLEHKIIANSLLESLAHCELCQHKDDKKIIKHLKKVMDFYGVKYK